MQEPGKRALLWKEEREPGPAGQVGSFLTLHVTGQEVERPLRMLHGDGLEAAAWLWEGQVEKRMRADGGGLDLGKGSSGGRWTNQISTKTRPTPPGGESDGG